MLALPVVIIFLLAEGNRKMLAVKTGGTEFFHVNNRIYMGIRITRESGESHSTVSSDRS